MDILAHALWTTAAAIAIRRQLHRPLNLGWAAFCGVFPDLVTFVIPAIVRIWWYVTGVTASLFPDANSGGHFQFVWRLYDASHSLVVFAAIFALAWLFAGRPVLELLGWALHILIDIPTHQGIFAPHFLWPLSFYRVSGFRWESRWFFAVNYGAMLLVFLSMWVRAWRSHPTSHESVAMDQ
jgi:hypothetical protein